MSVDRVIGVLTDTNVLDWHGEVLWKISEGDKTCRRKVTQLAPCQARAYAIWYFLPSDYSLTRPAWRAWIFLGLILNPRLSLFRSVT
jgi:hypothetical protein